MFNAGNPHQGAHKRVLCVCSAGLLRSPTAAVVLSQEPFNFNTRAVGIEESYALVPVDEVLIAWADEIVVMTKQHRDLLVAEFGTDGDFDPDPVFAKIKVLNIPDDFAYRDPELMKLIAERYRAAA
jgi:predicted protein tyrosine phosphatase